MSDDVIPVVVVVGEASNGRETVAMAEDVKPDVIVMDLSIHRLDGTGTTTNDSIERAREEYDHLTRRERDVLRLTGQGYSAPEIGRRLAISPKTVDTYKQRIQQKLNFTHRSQYVQFALKLGLLTQP